MAAAEGLVPSADKKTVVSVIVAVVIIVLLYMGYQYFFNSKPDGGLTQEEYDKLTAADKALWKKSGNYYVKA